MMHLKTICLLLAAMVFGLAFLPEPNGTAPKMRLSEYGFFIGSLPDFSPAPGVFPYQVNAPLFSDYAEKARFIALPSGTSLGYQANAAFDFPTGAVIIKHFYYFKEAAHPEKGKQILETRLLMREENGWKALTYVWNTEQTDAVLEVAGATIPVQWKNAAGQKQQIDYTVPNLNQCKGCHSLAGAFVPIGVTARQLNRKNDPQAENQLLQWHKDGLLKAPEDLDLAQAPRLNRYDDPSDGDLNARARAYLDANCAHCHHPQGPASTSGMFLQYNQQDQGALGIMKAPVAAGRGSGNRKYGIYPGKPQESILLYRMEHNDPGIRMPELGRQMAHKEGIELIKQWIKSLE
jgi:uncharacterized repeat protein (TIGR03806 family)